MSAAWERGSRAAVVALDPESQRLVRPALARPENTLLLDQDLPSTIPDRSADSIPRADEAAAPASERPWLHRAVVVPDGALGQPAVPPDRAPVPVELRDDPSTLPDRSDTPRSDVFAPLHAQATVDPEPPTPRGRPLRLDERPTDLDVRIAATATYAAAPARIGPERDSEQPDPRDRERHLSETARERALVESVYDSQRAFIVIKSQDPARAAHIASLKDALLQRHVFTERNFVLAHHAREKIALGSIVDERNIREREDQVLAIGLIARDLDDQYRAGMRELKDQLVDEIDELPAAKREAVFAEFDSFMESDGANDSHFCRRELHRALSREPELHRAYIYALALDKRRRPEAEAISISLSGEG